MQLEGEDSGLLGFAARVVDDLDGGMTVDRLRELASLGDDDVFVPILLFDGCGDFLAVAGAACNLLVSVGVDFNFLAPLRENAAASFLIQDADGFVARVDIGLIAVHDVVPLVGAAILNAAVASDDLELQPQLEVIHLAALPDEKGVALRGILRGRLPSNGAVTMKISDVKRVTMNWELLMFVAKKGRGVVARVLWLVKSGDTVIASSLKRLMQRSARAGALRLS
jgi:hypothetical protein